LHASPATIGHCDRRFRSLAPKESAGRSTNGSAASNHCTPFALTNRRSQILPTGLLFVDGTDHSTGVQIVIRVSKDDLQLLLDLVSVGAVAAATIGSFFGAAYLLLAPPRQAAAPADPIPSVQALEMDEVQPPGEDDTVAGPSWGVPADKVAASPRSDAPSDREALRLGMTAGETTLFQPRRITHARRVGVGRHRRQATAMRWIALWRPDASSGPNPGGGFYGPPNINVGYINPR
jgi:hypothetical protein